MKHFLFTLIFIFGTTTVVFSQETTLKPTNNPAKSNLIKSENYKMNWFMLQDTLKIQIGTVSTDIKKEKKKISIITKVNIKQSPNTWIDTTIVATKNFKPLYHSSFNDQRNMVLKFDETINGYYLDKKLTSKTVISEKIEGSFFDSNFYPQLIRFLPLKNNYKNTISIFDYNSTSKIGLITATIKNTQKATYNFNGTNKQVWIVETTDDISNNTTISNYYIEIETRKILKQEINFNGRKMVMELVK